MGRFPGYTPVIPGLTPDQWASPVTDYMNAKMAAAKQRLMESDMARKWALEREQERRNAAIEEQNRVLFEQKKTEFQQAQGDREIAAREKVIKDIVPAMDPRAGKLYNPSLGKSLAASRGGVYSDVPPEPVVVPTRTNSPDVAAALAAGDASAAQPRPEPPQPTWLQRAAQHLPYAIRPDRAPDAAPQPQDRPLTTEEFGQFVTKELPAPPLREGPGAPGMPSPADEDRAAISAQLDVSKRHPMWQKAGAAFQASREATAQRLGLPSGAMTKDMQAAADKRYAEEVAAARLAPTSRFDFPAGKYGAPAQTVTVRPGESEAARKAIVEETAARFEAAAKSGQIDPHRVPEVLTTAQMVRAGQMDPKQAMAQLDLYLTERGKGDRTKVMASDRGRGSDVAREGLAFRKEEKKRDRTEADFRKALLNRGLSTANETYSLIDSIKQNLQSDNPINQAAGMMDLYQLRVKDPRISESDYRYGVQEVAGKLEGLKAAVKSWTDDKRLPAGTAKYALEAVNDLEGRIKKRHLEAMSTLNRSFMSENYDYNYYLDLAGERIPEFNPNIVGPGRSAGPSAGGAAANNPKAAAARKAAAKGVLE